ncbi:MAG: antitermination protein NusB [bacterium]
MDTIVINGQYVVGWGTLALINSVLAQSKNRSGLLWFIASLFFGPLCTLLIAILSKVPANGD